jgi:hypothetical protein
MYMCRVGEAVPIFMRDIRVPIQTGTGTNGLTATANALSGLHDNSDFYFFVLQKECGQPVIRQLLWREQYGSPTAMATMWMGGPASFDAQGVIYEAICANCYGNATFPATLGAYQTANGTATGTYRV